jgi:hypothetical protein
MRPLTLEPTATVGVLANPSGECAPQLLAIEAWAGAQGLRTVDLGTTDRAGELPEAGGLVIALGGDGTILRALQLAMVHHSPVLGVNFGHLGFLADVDGDDLAAALDRIARGEAQIDERTALVATSQTPVPRTVIAFNDFVISRRPGFGSARLRVEVSGEPVLDLTVTASSSRRRPDRPRTPSGRAARRSRRRSTRSCSHRWRRREPHCGRWSWTVATRSASRRPHEARRSPSSSTGGRCRTCRRPRPSTSGLRRARRGWCGHVRARSTATSPDADRAARYWR